MPPNLDIYVLTKQRDLPTIESFLDTFVDRAASEDRGDEELMLVSLAYPDADPAKAGEPDYWIWEPSQTLTHIIERGLDFPRRAFTTYLKVKDEGIERAMLTFTADDQLVLGLSIDDPMGQPENEQRAQELLHQMAEQSMAILGMISAEEPPSLSEREFRQQEGIAWNFYFWHRDEAEIRRSDDSVRTLTPPGTNGRIKTVPSGW